MASASLPGKEKLLDPYSPSSPLGSKYSYFLPLSPLINAYDRFAQWREDLGLPHPGTVENIQKEAKGFLARVFVENNLCSSLSLTLQPRTCPTMHLMERART